MMELGPILRALLYNKTRFWLIALEVALTLAIVANCVNMLLDLRGDFMRESGYDEPNLIVVTTRPFGSGFTDEEYRDVVRENDLAALRAFPGVADATAMQAIPMSGGGSATGRRAAGSDLDDGTTPYFRVTDHAVSTLGVRLVAGRDFEPGDFELEPDENGDIRFSNAIVSQALADRLFPDGNALGGRIEDRQGETSNTIIGITEHMHNSWPEGWELADHAMLLPGKPGDERRMHYMVRTEPGAVEAVYSGLEPKLLELNGERIIETKTLTETKQEYYSTSLGLIKLLGAVIVLLVLVTSLGIVGLTSFSVTQRRRQIGTRRALGARRVDIVRYFLIENWMITGLGMVLGLGLTFALNYALVHVADAPKMQWPLILIGMAILWISGVLAALAPALRAANVAPEVATRSV
jgi:putative ABC transport system permease protein